MVLPFFGEVVLDELEEYYETSYTLSNDSTCNLELWFDEEKISEEAIQPILSLLQKLPEHVEQANVCLFKMEEGRQCLQKYLSHHFDVLEESEKTSFGISNDDTKEEAVQKLEQKVYLKSISFWSGGPEVMKYDFTIGHLITDYIVCIGFNSDGKMESVEIES